MSRLYPALSWSKLHLSQTPFGFVQSAQLSGEITSMNLKKLAFAGLMLAFAGFQTASAENAGRWEQWLNSYYQHPQPSKVVQAAFGLSQEDYYSQPGATATAIGF